MALAFLSGLPEFTSKSYGQVIQFQVIEMNIVSGRMIDPFNSNCGIQNMKYGKSKWRGA